MIHISIWPGLPAVAASARASGSSAQGLPLGDRNTGRWLVTHPHGRLLALPKPSLCLSWATFPSSKIHSLPCGILIRARDGLPNVCPSRVPPLEDGPSKQGPVALIELGLRGDGRSLATELRSDRRVQHVLLLRSARGR